MSKNKIAIIFGGKSAEFEVSLKSASNIFNAVDRSKYEVILVGIDQKGNWFYDSNFVATHIDFLSEFFFDEALSVKIERRQNQICIIETNTYKILDTFDVAFSITHGTFGEDGTLQGFFKTLDIPFVGPDILASSICMDKEITKKLLRDNNIPIANFITLRKNNENMISFEMVKEKLGLPMFVKPCNAGSSVGVNKVVDEKSYITAIKEAFQYDFKVLIEEAVIGKEVECAILGNEKPKASVIGEIIPTKGFYSFDAKYNDSDGAKMKIPAEIDPTVEQKLRETAISAFKTVECEGMSRIDFFLREDNTFVLNEINTLPGFTEISMYPKLWEKSGINYIDLITELVELSIERSERNKKLKNASR